MRSIDIEKEIRRMQSYYKHNIKHKNFVIKNKSNILTNMCGDNTMLRSSKHIVKQLFNIVENYDVITSIVNMAIGALLYIISPMDIVPDFIPVVGFVDDVCIVKEIMRLILKNNEYILKNKVS